MRRLNRRWLQNAESIPALCSPFAQVLRFRARGQEMTKEFGALDLQVARARVVVSIVAVLSIYIDPNADGLFHLGPLLLTTLGCHLLYSAIANVAVTRHRDSSAVRALSTILDLSFAT